MKSGKQAGTRTTNPRMQGSTSVAALERPLRAAQVLGNAGLQQLLRAHGLQAKLAVSHPQDPYEQEADRVADQVMRTPESQTRPAMGAAPSVQRHGVECRDELHRSAAAEAGAVVDTATEAAIAALAGRGRPLPKSVRAFMEPRFNADFAAVRVHDDAQAHQLARSLSAQAFTVGSNVVFGAGRYVPDSDAGKRLLAHELTHVVQQAGAPVALQRSPDDSMDAILSEPLTPNDMYHQLLLQRAGPLSIGVTQVNAASKRIGEIDDAVAPLKGRLAQAEAVQREPLNAQIGSLLKERRTLSRGQALGSFGKGRPAGTGQITYVAMQVVDRQGRRIALEFATTNATEHAEEAMIRRLSAALTPEQLSGARLLVVGDQQVCEERCRGALERFGEHFDLASVEAEVFVRERVVGAGDATPRTTLKTSTQRASEGLVPRKLPTNLIYQRPASPPKPGSPGSPTVARQPPVHPAEVSPHAGPTHAANETAPHTRPPAVTVEHASVPGAAPAGERRVASPGAPLEAPHIHGGGSAVLSATEFGAAALLSAQLESVRNAERARAEAALAELMPQIEDLRSQGRGVTVTIVVELPEQFDVMAAAASVGDVGQRVLFNRMFIESVSRPLVTARADQAVSSISANDAPGDPAAIDPHDLPLQAQIRWQMGDRTPLPSMRPRRGYRFASRSQVLPGYPPKATHDMPARGVEGQYRPVKVLQHESGKPEHVRTYGMNRGLLLRRTDFQLIEATLVDLGDHRPYTVVDPMAALEAGRVTFHRRFEKNPGGPGNYAIRSAFRYERTKDFDLLVEEAAGEDLDPQWQLGSAWRATLLWVKVPR